MGLAVGGCRRGWRTRLDPMNRNDSRVPISRSTSRSPRLWHPADSTRVLESFGLDYCCGGQRSLGVACSDAGIGSERRTLHCDLCGLD
jgi:hypothetical protein